MKWILYLWTQKIVTLLTHRDYYLTLVIKYIDEERKKALIYQVLVFTILGKIIKKTYSINKFKISARTWKDELNLELLTHETMKLFGSTENKKLQIKMVKMFQI